MTDEEKVRLWNIWQDLGSFGIVCQNDDFHFTFIANNEEIRDITNAVFAGLELEDILEKAGGAYEN